ncbi:unnamed protein product [Victoria cruziana]
MGTVLPRCLTLIIPCVVGSQHPPLFRVFRFFVSQQVHRSRPPLPRRRTETPSASSTFSEVGRKSVKFRFLCLLLAEAP